MAACIAALSLAATASHGAASVTIGQTAPTNNDCSGFVDLVQPTVTSGNAYVVPATVAAGTITSWSTQSNAGGGMLAMKVYRPLGGLSYMVVGHEGPRTLTGGALNTFPASVAVKAGDVLGNSTPMSPGSPGCHFNVPGETRLERVGNLPDGGSGDFGSFSNLRLNISAVVSPSNSFTLGAVTRNKRMGTATLKATVPNPGKLAGSGKGVKVAGTAAIAKTVSAPGDMKLTIKAKGKKKATLNETGKVKVKPKITYTPTGGDPSTQAIKVKLKKNL